MKKRLIKTSILLALGTIGFVGFNMNFVGLDSAKVSILANAEALASGESGTNLIIGHCGNTDGDCLATCPHCGEMYYATSGKLGPSSDVRGNCKTCKKPM